MQKFEANIRSWTSESSPAAAGCRTECAQEQDRGQREQDQRRNRGRFSRELAESARQYIPERVQYYAPKVGVDYGSITIRSQKSRWGSCSSKGNLSFNCLLMLTPPEVIDSVVVHELCHRKEMNHSAAFYAHVLRVFPEYQTWRRWLKENGPALLLRVRAHEG